MKRLDHEALARLPDAVARPGYDPRAHATGIVHLGCGAFHRAHQAVYTDAALARSGGDWRIASVSLRSTDIADALAPQDNLYTLIEQTPEGNSARIVGSLSRVIAAAREPEAVLDALSEAAVRVVTITVTEKGYGIDRDAGDVDPNHPAVAADLRAPRTPKGVLSLIVEALRRRFDAGLDPFTVLCCDNLPDNGHLVRAGVLGFARRVDPALAEAIAQKVAFPSSMVDRITPAASEETFREAGQLTGLRDDAAIATEGFSQWVVEDVFPFGRPDWEAGGALFVAAVGPYETMKLRMLNGAHSLIAYAGFLAGHAYVRDVMDDPALSRLVRRHLAAAAATLPEVPGIDLGVYADDLCRRFANRAIAHQTYQIAMDGSQKLPQRLAAPALDALDRGRETRPFAFAIAAWMRYALGRTETGETYALRDPVEETIAREIEAAGEDGSAIADRLLALRTIFPERLAQEPGFAGETRSILAAFMERGLRETIEAEARAV